MKLKKCRKCGKIFPANLSHCPDCYARNNDYTFAVVLSIFVAIAVFVLILCMFEFFSDNPNEVIRGTDADIIASEATISLDEFNRIESGMTYEEVCKVIGGNGVLTTSTDYLDDPKYKTEIYQWTGEGSVGANAIITFTGGKVDSKAQYGLK